MESPEIVHVNVHLPADTERDTDRMSTLEPLWSWRQLALCRGMDSSVFFPSEAQNLPARRRREQVAKAICAACPARQPCAAYGLANRELQGVWGGLSEADRAAEWRGVWPTTRQTRRSSAIPGRERADRCHRSLLHTDASTLRGAV